MKQEQFWLNNFVGREKDIKYLYKQYNIVKQLKQPTFITLLGESGVGKTRLIRAFYEHLRIREDKIGYWPKDFQGNYINLDLNPDYSNHVFNDGINQKDTSFYWWGIRFHKNDSRNRIQQNQCSILQSAEFLEIHFAFLRQKELLEQDKKEALDLAGDALLEFIPEAVSAMIPGAGLIKPMLQKYRTNIENKKEIEQINSALEKPEGIQKQKASSFKESIFKGLGALLEDGTPMVLILDDLHWIDSDSGDIITELFLLAQKEKWPLMFLSTCWNSKWNENLENMRNPLGKLIKNFSETSGSSFIEKKLEYISETDEILKQGLPGLTIDQQTTVLEKFAADLYALNIFIEDWRRKPRLFKDRDINNKLTQTGINKVMSYTHPRLNIVQERFDDFEDELQELLGCASIQGMNFIKDLLYDIVSENNIWTTSIKSEPSALLDVLENRYLFVKNILHSARFFEPVNFEVANNFAKEVPDELVVIEKETWNVIKQWVEQQKHKDLNDNELMIFLQISENIYAQIKETSDEDTKISNLLWLHKQLVSNESVKKLTSTDLERIMLLLEVEETANITPLSWRVKWFENLLSNYYYSLQDICDRYGLLRLRIIAIGLYGEISKSLMISPSFKDIESLKSVSENMATLTYKTFNNSSFIGDRFETYEDEEKYEKYIINETIDLVKKNINNFPLTNTKYRLINIVNYSTLIHLAPTATDMRFCEDNIATLVLDIDTNALKDNDVCKLLFNGPITRTVGSLMARVNYREKETIFQMLHYIRDSLNSTQLSKMDLYPLITVAYSLTNLAQHDEKCTSYELYDKAFAIALELIKRDATELVGDWLSIGSMVGNAVGLNGKDNLIIMSRGSYVMRPDHFDQIWEKTSELIYAIKDEGSNIDNDKLIPLYLKVITSTLFVYVQSGKDNINFHDQFFKIFLNHFSDIENFDNIVRYVWINRMRNVFSQDTNKCEFIISAYGELVKLPKSFTQKKNIQIDNRIDEKIEDLVIDCVKKDKSVLDELVKILIDAIHNYEDNVTYVSYTLILSMISLNLNSHSSKEFIEIIGNLPNATDDPIVSIEKIKKIWNQVQQSFVDE